MRSSDNPGANDVFSVVLVEDEQATREYLATAINKHPALRLLAACSSLMTARKAMVVNSPDVLLTDLALPDGDGVTLIREVKHTNKSCECMVISVFGTEKRVLEAIAAGATGYLLKDETVEHICEAILSLIRGGSPMSPSIARHLLDVFQRQNISSTADVALTDREIAVLSGLAKGYTYQELAKLMTISPHTLGTHCKNIYRKLEVRSRSEAVFEAVHRGLIHLL